jgi:hypothetical protein
MLFEAFGLWSNFDQVKALSSGAWVGVAILTIGLDTIFL